MKITHTKHNKFLDSLKEVATSLLPIIMLIALLMVLLSLFMDSVEITSELWVAFIGGIVMVLVGMSLFLYGSGISMMRIGSKTGSFIVKKGKLGIILFFGFFLGYLVTNAEPDLLVLSRQVTSINPAIHKTLLITIISIGTGLFLALALFRAIKKIHLVRVLLIAYSIVFAIAITSMMIAPKMVALAFDSSGVTTGPVTVPFILAFAAGVSKMIKGEQESNASFGMVGITSIGAILAVLIMGVYFR